MKWLQHPEAGAQYRNDHQRLREHAAGGGFHGGGDQLIRRGEIAGSFKREEERDLITEGPEKGGLSRLVAQMRQHMSAERMGQEVEGHNWEGKVAP